MDPAPPATEDAAIDTLPADRPAPRAEDDPPAAPPLRCAVPAAEGVAADADVFPAEVFEPALPGVVAGLSFLPEVGYTWPVILGTCSTKLFP